MNPERTLQERIQESKKIRTEIGNALPRHFPQDDRRVLARCAISLSLQHHLAITTLTESRLYPSAQAMLRPLLEAATIAYWILYTASSESIGKIASSAPLEGADGKDDTPPLGQMLKELEESSVKPPYVEDMREAYKSPQGRWLNKYTHGGIPQLRRLRPDHPEFNEVEMYLAAVRADNYLVISAHSATLIYTGEQSSQADEIKALAPMLHRKLFDEVSHSPNFVTNRQYKPLLELPDPTPKP